VVVIHVSSNVLVVYRQTDCVFVPALLQIIVIVSPLIKLTRVKGAAIDDIGTPEGILNR
jgi:hypothetical protein